MYLNYAINSYDEQFYFSFSVKLAIENCLFTCFEDKIPPEERFSRDRKTQIKPWKSEIEVIGDSNLKIKPFISFEQCQEIAITNDGHLILLVSDGTSYKYEDAKWNEFNQVPGLSPKHSDMKAVTLPDGMHLFGCSKYNFLPNGSSQWIDKKLENVYADTAAPMVEVPGNKIVTIPATNYFDQFEILDTESVEWSKVPAGRFRAIGAIIGYFKGKLFMTGGMIVMDESGLHLNRISGKTLVYSLPDFTAVDGPDLNVPRHMHGMGIIRVGGVPKLIVFGGVGNDKNKLDSIEEWDEEQQQWKMSTMKMSEPNACFSYCFKSVVN